MIRNIKLVSIFIDHMETTAPIYLKVWNTSTVEVSWTFVSFKRAKISKMLEKGDFGPHSQGVEIDIFKNHTEI